MAKKKAATAKPESKRTPVMLRIDDDVYQRIKHLADGAEISLNQLMQAVARWVAEYGHLGEPIRDSDGILREKQQVGCIWVGKVGASANEVEDTDFDPYEDQRRDFKGELHLFLDFTERRVLREDVEGETSARGKDRRSA